MTSIFTSHGGARPREGTGRMGRICLGTFFPIVGAVNAIMMGAADPPCAGPDSAPPYAAGVAVGVCVERVGGGGWATVPMQEWDCRALTGRAMTEASDLSMFVSHGDAGIAHMMLAVEGVGCAGCIRKIERGLKQIPGIVDAR